MGMECRSVVEDDAETDPGITWGSPRPRAARANVTVGCEVDGPNIGEWRAVGETEDGPELGPVSADSLSPISNAPVPRPSRDEPALDRET